jgi:hypothetical protein
MNLRVDPFNQALVDAGPAPAGAASALPSAFLGHERAKLVMQFCFTAGSIRGCRRRFGMSSAASATMGGTLTELRAATDN